MENSTADLPKMEGDETLQRLMEIAEKLPEKQRRAACAFCEGLLNALRRSK